MEQTLLNIIYDHISNSNVVYNYDNKHNAESVIFYKDSVEVYIDGVTYSITVKKEVIK